ncbi:uncharacterized protein LOC111047128 isoform X2 [Nilaparvata lugens]|uniref:uncharacterized protein LOC111047128 isoform X2 n=1 Tax=Nilaparvata lugens TaxID=108931 RepID=UPI00193DB679|nr:uncharacterized protein LOC111047128 isoform X2 [Nilaparvata lugens]
MASASAESEVDDLASGLASCSIDFERRLAVEERLTSLDIPFNWKPQNSGSYSNDPEVAVTHFKRKLEEMCEKQYEVDFNRFCCHLTLAQELNNHNTKLLHQKLTKHNSACALKNVLQCEPWFKSVKTGTCGEKDILSISKAIEYIHLGSKAFALFKCGFQDEAEKLLREIPVLKAMEDEQVSGIYGVKAWTFKQYGVTGFEKALEFINVARTKHPTMAEWHFLTGRILSKIRYMKFTFMAASDEEANSYCTAYKLNPENEVYGVYVAQITREKAYQLFQESRHDREQSKKVIDKIDKMNDEAFSLYMKMLESENKDASVLALTAYGLAKLPKPYRKVNLAVKTILKALELYPSNPFINHYAGLIHIRYVKDTTRGLVFLKQAVEQRNVPALMDLLKLRSDIDPHFDPMPWLTKALERYEDYKSIILTEMASWYFFKKEDVFRAWHHLKKITNDYFAKNHKCSTLRMTQPCNLYEVIFDEVKLLLAQERFKMQIEKEMKLMSIHKKMQKYCPWSHPTDYRNCKVAIFNESDRIMRFEQERLNRSGVSNERGCNLHASGSNRSSTDDLSRGDSTFMRGNSSNPRGRSSYNRGSSTNVRSGSNATGGFSNSRGGWSRVSVDANADKSASQTGLNIVLSEDTSSRDDTRSRDSEKSNRGRGGTIRGRAGITHENIQSEGDNSGQSASQTGLVVVLDEVYQNSRRDTRTSGRGRSNRGRGPGRVTRGGHNDSGQSASQTGLVVVLDEVYQNSRRDTRTSGRGRSNRGRGPGRVTRGGHNDSGQSASQTGLVVVLDEVYQNSRRDTRTSGRGRSNRGRGPGRVTRGGPTRSQAGSS